MTPCRPGLIALTVLLPFATLVAYAQTSLGTSSLGGTVTDSSGLLIPNARVELTDTEHGLTREALTNDGGSYV
ncbi:MAG: carboxypeptidase-like regulatory domain-containing protein [Acidobacteriota bacterium]|nr:carboxypeptidase-like regulatory domain-containing protein [Acidobacteriota bacterium]